jgi:hypothetical protein
VENMPEPLFFGKSGADAIAKYFASICRIITKYQDKLKQAIDLTRDAGHITADQAIAAKAFIDAATATCAIFQIVAKHSGFTG